jgi:cytochrome c peroxidase
VGGQEGARKAPTVINAAFAVSPRFFWDGRARSLAEQALGPLTNPVEMGNTLAGVAAAVGGVAGYRRAFREVYGDGRVDVERIADAIVAYEATRLSGGSAYDRFQAGDDAALSPLAQRGLEVFFGSGRCNACHLGPTFSDARFHNVGVGYAALPGPAVASGFRDPGRYAIPGAPADLGAFKTPGLRDLSARAPYMHDGSSPDLRDAVLRYVAVADNPWLDPAMREVEVTTADVEPLVAFLRALDGTGYEDRAPPSLPR